MGPEIRRDVMSTLWLWLSSPNDSLQQPQTVHRQQELCLEDRKRTGDQIKIEIDQQLSDYCVAGKQPRRHSLICRVYFLLKVPEGEFERLCVGGAQLQMWHRAACDKRAVCPSASALRHVPRMRLEAVIIIFILIITIIRQWFLRRSGCCNPGYFWTTTVSWEGSLETAEGYQRYHEDTPSVVCLSIIPWLADPPSLGGSLVISWKSWQPRRWKLLPAVSARSFIALLWDCPLTLLK